VSNTNLDVPTTFLLIALDRLVQKHSPSSSFHYDTQWKIPTDFFFFVSKELISKAFQFFLQRVTFVCNVLNT